MYFDDKKDDPRIEFFYRSIPVVFLLLSLGSFWGDYSNTFKTVAGVLGQFTGGPAFRITPEITKSFSIVFYNLLGGLLVFFVIWVMILSSQSLLPVRDIFDIIPTAGHLVLYILGMHGAAIIVRDGKLGATPEELQKPLPGVAVIDFNSAMVLERVVVPPGCLTVPMRIILWPLRQLIQLFVKNEKQPPVVRVRGPGLTFIDFNERIQGVGDLDQNSTSVENITGVVDLRRQFRISRRQSDHHPDNFRTSVRGYTRDGIELNTNISALFTVGQDPNKSPHVIQVTYIGDPIPANLRIVAVEEKDGQVKIKSMDDDLDDADRNEINKVVNDGIEISGYAPIPTGHREPEFNADRVFSAVYSRARQRAPVETVMPWSDMPVHVAIDFFREILSGVNFDELYQLDSWQTLRIDMMRRQLRTRMRNCSLLSYRFIALKNSQPLEIGKSYLQSELMTGPVQALTASKILRDQGIQVIISGFSDLLPEEMVFRQWLASWRSSWEKDTMTAQALADLEVSRILSRARANAQDDLQFSLREIFQTNNHSMEVIAIRIFQALESIAADDKTRKLLPEETLGMLNNIHNWLLPADMGYYYNKPHEPSE